jgi:hypothetical protein
MAEPSDLKALYTLIFEARTTLDTAKLLDNRAARAIELLTAALALADALTQDDHAIIPANKAECGGQGFVARDASFALDLIKKAKTIARPDKALTQSQSAQLWNHLDVAEARLDGLLTFVELSPAEMGRKGGSKTAKRGPEYFSKIAGMRKTKAGGRPKKPKQ